jgi:hypothetical protein
MERLKYQQQYSEPMTDGGRALVLRLNFTVSLSLLHYCKRQQNRIFKFLFKILFWYHLSFFDVAYIPSSILVLGLKVKPITSRC